MINTELHNGDCLEYMKKIPTSSIDLIITDPPYNLGKFMEERDTNLVKMRDNFFGAAGWDDLDYKEWKKSMNKFFHQASRVLKDGGSIIVFMAIEKKIKELSEKELQNEKVIIDILRKCFEDKEDIASMAEGDNLEMLVEKVMELVRNLYL